MKNEIIDIYNICVTIREVIFKLKNNTYFFKNFPLGCCRDASIIIAEILIEKGYRDITYCRNVFDNETKSHAWLEYKGYIIDITADQFKGNHKKIIVKSNQLRLLIHKNPKIEKYNLKNFINSGCIDLFFDIKFLKENINLHIT